MNDLWEFTPSTSQWTWKGGKSTVPLCYANWNDDCSQPYLPGVYGSKGVPAPANIPAGVLEAPSWTDKKGNFWLFDDWGSLWEFTPSTNEWAWKTGTEETAGSAAPHSNLGIQGVPDPGNTPASANGIAVWTDGRGDLWMFDGVVWKFQP